MTMLVATDLLELLIKADKLGATYKIKAKTDGFEVAIYSDWYKGDYQYHTVFITNENESTWEKGDYEFSTMMEILDEKLEEQLQEEIKARKRQELIARLTNEEKELLNLK